MPNDNTIIETPTPTTATAATDATEAPSAEFGAIVEVPDPRVLALRNLCADVCSFFAHNDETALSISRELQDPEQMPDPQNEEHEQKIEEYRSTLRDLYAIRTALDEYKVHTPPAEGTEYHGIWADYSERVYKAYQQRAAL